jgi:hypothetical protein
VWVAGAAGAIAAAGGMATGQSGRRRWGGRGGGQHILYLRRESCPNVYMKAESCTVVCRIAAGGERLFVSFMIHIVHICRSSCARTSTPGHSTFVVDQAVIVILEDVILQNGEPTNASS